MLLLSLYRGTSGFARSLNHAFRFVSFNVAREGIRKVDDLGARKFIQDNKIKIFEDERNLS